MIFNKGFISKKGYTATVLSIADDQFVAHGSG
jgi:hypothetical protein